MQNREPNYANLQFNQQNEQETIFKVILNSENEISERHKEDGNLNGFIYQLKYFPKTKQLSFPYVSSGLKNIYGISPEVLKRTASPILSKFYKGDFANVQHKLYASMINLSTFSVDYRLVLPNNDIKWLRTQAKPMRLDDGSFVWSGYVKDISHLRIDESSSFQVSRPSKNGEILNLVKIISQNLNSNFEQFNTLYNKLAMSSCVDEKQKIISFLREISTKFTREKAYINEIIKVNS